MGEDTGILLCEGCGYQLRGIRPDESGLARCPECGEASDARSPGRLRPWPPRAAVAWRLSAPMAANMAAVMAMLVLTAAVGVENLPRRPVAVLFIMLVLLLPVTGLVHPGLGAVLLAERHAPRRGRTRAAAAAFAIAAAVNAAVFGVGVLIAWALDAW